MSGIADSEDDQVQPPEPAQESAPAGAGAGEGTATANAARRLRIRRGTYVISCLVTIAVVIIGLRTGLAASWYVIGAVLIGLVGIDLWAPTIMDPASLAAFGTALATGAVVSGMFAILSARDTANENRIASIEQRQQSALALRAQERQAQLSASQTRAEELNLQLTVTRDLSGVDLSNTDLSARSLNLKNLSDATLFKTNLDAARMYETDLADARLNLASLKSTYLRSATLSNALLQGANVTEADFDEATLAGANFGVYRNGLTLVAAANLTAASFLDANLAGACLAGADLRGANLGGANLWDADLDGANLTGAKLILSGLPANTSGASIAGATIPRSLLPYFRHRARVSPGLVRALAAGDRVPAGAAVGRVTQVADGQTAYVAPIGWVRLIGLTVPNTTEPYGPAAERLLRTIFGKGDVIRYVLGRVPRERRWGGTGRWLIYAWTQSGQFVNEQLLASGLAVRRADSEERGAYASLFNDAALAARARDLGVWRICPAPQR